MAHGKQTSERILHSLLHPRVTDHGLFLDLDLWGKKWRLQKVLARAGCGTRARVLRSGTADLALHWQLCAPSWPQFPDLQNWGLEWSLPGAWHSERLVCSERLAQGGGGRQPTLKHYRQHLTSW